MVYHGTVIKGVVVLDDAAGLRDGTRVNIQPVLQPAAQADDFHPVGAWDGPAGEFDRLLQDVQSLRDADLTLEDEGRDESLPA